MTKNTPRFKPGDRVIIRLKERSGCSDAHKFHNKTAIIVSNMYQNYIETGYDVKIPNTNIIKVFIYDEELFPCLPYGHPRLISKKS